jgi:hypothetical protein
VLVEDEVALGIHRVRHIPGVDAQQPFTFAGETDLQQFGIMKAWCVPEPLNERIASGNVMQYGNGTPHDAQAGVSGWSARDSKGLFRPSWSKRCGPQPLAGSIVARDFDTKRI